MKKKVGLILAGVVTQWKGLGIGKGNTIPWNSKAEMALFRKSTVGCPVIMGRKTMESLPDRAPLQGRINIVVTSGTVTDGFIATDTLEKAIQIGESVARQTSDVMWVIGGSLLAQAAIDGNFVDFARISYIKKKHECGTFLQEKYLKKLEGRARLLVAETEDFKCFDYWR